MLYGPNITFQKKKIIIKFIPHCHLKEVKRVRASKTLQITIIQSVIDAAVCENKPEKKYRAFHNVLRD
jgi:hypothetical protein